MAVGWSPRAAALWLSLGLTATLAQLAGASVNVEDFGAKHDGVTDDTASIQRAIDSLPSGGLVLLPAGQYNISGSVSVPHDYTILRGEGRATRLITNQLPAVSAAGSNPGAELAVVEFSASQ
jgi:hypothetical protein